MKNTPKKADGEISRFMSFASHELRNPISNIMEAVSQVIDGIHGAISPEQQQILGIAHRNCIQLGKIINDLSEYSRADSSTIVLSGKPGNKPASHAGRSRTSKASAPRHKMAEKEVEPI